MRTTKRKTAFTLVELLVVIAIIAALIALLLPMLTAATRAAKDVKCRSNMRQICAALINYATDHKGKFPPNLDLGAPQPYRGVTYSQYWCDPEHLGKYLSISRTGGWLYANFMYLPNTLIGGILACPADDYGSRSYAINWWASSIVTTRLGAVSPVSPDWPGAGKAWGLGAKSSSRLLLIAETWSWYPDGKGGYMTPPTVGDAFSGAGGAPVLDPGWHFIGYTLWFNQIPPVVRYMPCQTRFDYARHRKPGDSAGNPRPWPSSIDPCPVHTQARGRMNIGFADGHVAQFAAQELADPRTLVSKFTAMWTPLDPMVERAQYNLP